MHHILLDLIKTPLFVFFCLFLFVVFSIIIKIYKKHLSVFFVSEGRPQSIHDKITPALGGIIIFVSLFFFTTINYVDYQTNFTILSLLICFIPIGIPALYEDFTNKETSPILRLFLIITSSCLILFIFIDNLPVIDTPIFSDIISNNGLIIHFLMILFMAAMINGMNMIDGCNGLMAITAIFQLLSLLFLADFVGDYQILKIIFLLLFPLLIFLIKNYPFGKIFMGDFGAYFYGFAISSITIKLLGDYPIIPSWIGVLILFYPAMEVIFSFFRKLVMGKNPLKPDTLHFHIKLFSILRKSGLSKEKANSLVAPLMAIIWITPFALLKWSYFNNTITIFSIFSMIMIYTILYFSIPND